MKKIIFLLLLFVGFSAFGQYTPAKNVYGSQNVYGNQYIKGHLWLNNYGFPLNKGAAGQSLKLSGDSLIFYTPTAAAGFDSTHCWSELKTSKIAACTNLFSFGVSNVQSGISGGVIGIGNNTSQGICYTLGSSNTQADWNQGGSFVFGNGNNITNMGYYIGRGNTSTTQNAPAFILGDQCANTANFSSSIGVFLTSQSYMTHYIGRYNIARGTIHSWIDTEDLFVIGNGSGTGVNSNNALTILKNGSAYIGDATPATDPIMTVNTSDSTTTLIGVLKLIPLADAPTPAQAGMIYTDTDTHIYYYNGTSWVKMDN
jgi:hypothetical protein